MWQVIRILIHVRVTQIDYKITLLSIQLNHGINWTKYLPLRSDCEDAACQKMKMVILHYRKCRSKRREHLKRVILQSHPMKADEDNPFEERCQICIQLLKIVSRHALYDCFMPYHERGCPLFMCDSIRRIHYARILAKCRLSIKI